MTLHALFNEIPQGIADAPPEQLSAVIAQLAACQSAAAARLMNSHESGAAPRETTLAEQSALLTIEQVAQRLNVPKSNAYELVRQHKLRSVRIGKYVRVSPDMLAQYMATLAASPQAATMPPFARRK